MAATSEGFSLDELSLYSEVQAGVNPDAELDARPAPPPEREDGYLAIPTLIPNEDGTPFKKREEKDKGGNVVAEHPQLTVEFAIQDPGQRWDGAKFRSWPSTVVQRSQTTEMDAIIRAYTGQSPVGWSKGQKAKFCYDQFVGQAPIR